MDTVTIITIIGLTVAILSLIVAIITLVFALRINNKTTKLLRRITAVVVATKSQEEMRCIERLLVDIEKTKGKRGTVCKNSEGQYIINWTPTDEVGIYD